MDTYLAGVRIYDGRMVQVLLAANAPNAVNPTYRVSPGRIDAHLCGIYGTVRFDCPFAPQTNASALIVTGLCRGIVKDGIERCNNTRHVWYVHVENCSVITVPSE